MEAMDITMVIIMIKAVIKAMDMVQIYCFSGTSDSRYCRKHCYLFMTVDVISPAVSVDMMSPAVSVYMMSPAVSVFMMYVIICFKLLLPWLF